MNMRLSLVFTIMLLLQACASSLSSPVDRGIPSALAEKLHSLAGPSARDCGISVGEQNLNFGNSCMKSAHAQGAPFTFAWGPAAGQSGTWFAWAGSPQGKVYQLFLVNEAATAKDILAAECTGFEITKEKGVHCTIGRQTRPN
jgi:hypothetical protein